MSHEAGKGSDRRKEDTNKVRENYSLIFGESKLERRLREEREQAEKQKQEKQCNS